MKTLHVNACIVGGGPAGMLLGLMLAKRGAEVLVLEGHENFEREFRGEILQPSTAGLLNELGLLDYILAQPHSLIDTGKVRLNGHDIGDISFKRIAPEYPYAIWMPQAVFLNALHRKAQRLPSFQCWMGAQVSQLIEDTGRVVGVKGLHHGSESFEVRADIVVGADGRYSTIAKLGGFTPEYEHHDFDLIWFTIEQPPGWSNTMYVSLGDGVRGLMLPKYPHHIQTGIALPAGVWKQWRREGIAAVADRVRRFDPIFKPFADTLTDFTPFFPLECIIRLMREWARDGLLLIGDAAHTMSPAGAIGVNVALATAAVTAETLVPHLGRGPIAAADLKAIQDIREADVRLLHKLQLQAQRLLVSDLSTQPVVKWFMRYGLPVMLHTPIMSRLQRRMFFSVPIPPLDPAFRFENEPAAEAVA
jgi:2-polyprenyl-6-methoxyphenol hydroxylase-like FAD-dependent oxidoreductase